MESLEQLLPSLFCPLTLEVFTDPVIGSDGHTYERAAIKSWIQEKGTSPLTRESMSIDSLRENRIVTNLITELQPLLSRILHLQPPPIPPRVRRQQTANTYVDPFSGDDNEYF